MKNKCDQCGQCTNALIHKRCVDCVADDFAEILCPEDMTFVFPILFGDTSEVRILEAFVLHSEYLFYAREIGKLTGVESGAVVYKYITKLIYNDIVKSYSRDGSIDLFKLNCDNEITKKLIDLRRDIVFGVE